MGLFIGLVLGMFSTNLAGSLVVGLTVGLVGTRDFASTMQLVAGRYDVLCEPAQAEAARDMLAKLAI
ncbi:hypothetical protein ADUPG1_004768 [Aduncisulcus paluster]|uniref:Uncharacterized protein n=1 Tax=Aduncisulcus paluster TaxID=2918883 RepID=A0ABQ5K8P3_9EUKA|nr:hypothetical protein ADUPG1_004768 [Aduncisulcus paluster]